MSQEIGRVAGVYRLGGVEIDTLRACLRKDGEERHVRAKTFQVLLYLLEHRSRLVTRDELLAHVWFGAAVSDDTLTQCIGDIRRLLGDDPKNPAFLKTVPKLGFRFIGEVEEAASEIVEIETTTLQQVEVREEIATRPPRRTGVIVLAAAIAVALLAGWLLARTGATTPSRISVAVMPFENRTGAAGMGWLRQGLPDMLITSLSRSPKLELLSGERVAQLLIRGGRPRDATIGVADAIEAARLARAQVAIVGAFTSLDGALRLDVQLYDARDARLISGETLTVDQASNLLMRFDALPVRLAIAMQAPLPAAPGQGLLAEARSNNLEAFRAYTLGVERAEQFHGAEALALFQKAIELDPQFAMAQARIGYTLTVSEGNAAAGKPHLEKAFRQAAALTPKDRLYVTAWYAMANFDYGAAIRNYFTLIAEHPQEMPAYVVLARLLRGEKRHAEARDVLLRGQAIDPGWPDLYNILSGVYFELGEHEHAIASVRRFVELAPSEANAHDSLGLIYHRAGRYPEALEAYGRALELDPAFDLAVIHLGNTLAHLGRYREAIAQFRRFADLTAVPAQRGRALEAIAWLLWKSRDSVGAAAVLADWPDSPRMLPGSLP